MKNHGVSKNDGIAINMEHNYPSNTGRHPQTFTFGNKNKKKILKICPYLYKNSPKWTSIIFMRIINSDKSKVELIRQLRQSSSTIKAIVKDIIEKINERSSTFLAKTTSVLVATSIFK